MIGSGFSATLTSTLEKPNTVDSPGQWAPHFGPGGQLSAYLTFCPTNANATTESATFITSFGHKTQNCPIILV